MNDNLIRNNIKSYLQTHPVFNFSGVNVFVQKGVVVLAGNVLTKREKEFAEFFVNKVQGVNQVVSRLEPISEAITQRLPKLESVLARV